MYYVTIVDMNGLCDRMRIVDFADATRCYDAWIFSGTIAYAQFGIEHGGAISRFQGVIVEAGTTGVDFGSVEDQDLGDAPEPFVAPAGADFVNGHFEPREITADVVDYVKTLPIMQHQVVPHVEHKGGDRRSMMDATPLNPYDVDVKVWEIIGNGPMGIADNSDSSMYFMGNTWDGCLGMYETKSEAIGSAIKMNERLGKARAT